MEIVYSTLKGINLIIREIDSPISHEQLTKEDFSYVKIARLNEIQVLRREFFEKTKVNELMKI
jgi:hypothetical protein